MKAAALRGQELAEVQFFDGSDAEAFVLAVKANVMHGLPLSLTDRRAAAVRIMASHPTWSDGAVAAVTGLAPRTVSAVRRRAGGPADEAQLRVGLDGRARPLDHAAGRRRAGEIVAARPDASLREIADAAGISPATARDVRERVRQGDDPVRPGKRLSAARKLDDPVPTVAGAQVGDVAPAHHQTSLVQSLRNDPSLRFTDDGRALLRWLLPRATGAAGWNQFADQIPPHCVYLVARLARCCADDWRELAEYLEDRIRAMP